ncbi:integral membrane sensor signal transduction histidine kinase [Paraburkholderia phymatum STM815]|uniref:histidine kinase n=1 Tax=Paraburkholderia phymatum (strain DSM 17167 / CIP 108236 / LMG 21445 / STM815) TaxID=391038 RepID=B2JJF1_PARP8|nr:integral membrane sensor signal transduction histidine kinase [Paraburkholderia phymatum STM815]
MSGDTRAGADARLATRLANWMHQRSWAIAMTVAIVITCGGLVILETARQRIASEYEAALEARGVSMQLGELDGHLARLQAHESRFLLTKDDADAHGFCARAAQIHRGIRSLDAYFRRAADNAELASFTQIAALIEARIASGAQALQQASPHPLDLGACGSAMQKSGVDASLVTSTLALLRDNEERRAQRALDASRADQRVSTLVAAGLSALNIVLFILLFRNLGIQLDSQARVQKQLITQQEELDRLVNERTRQLEALGWHLQAVSENEKTQLARELHDELGAILTASKMDVAWARRKLQEAEPVVAEKLTRALATLDQGIALKRRIIEDMRPTVLANFGLVTALRTLGDEAAQRNGWALDLHLPDDELHLDEQVEIALFRVAQESLTNAAKYARATQIMIALSAGHGEVTLHIADNGIGIMPGDLTRTHTHGLMGMRQRVAARGGRFDVRRGELHGTEIRVVLPVPTVGLIEEPGNEPDPSEPRGESTDAAPDGIVAPERDRSVGRTPVGRVS